MKKYILRLQLLTMAIAICIAMPVFAQEVFTYTSSVTANSLHPDTNPGTKLCDGKWTNAGTESVQYDEDVTIIADLGQEKKINNVSVMVFHMSPFRIDEVQVSFSKDGNIWEKQETIKNRYELQKNIRQPALPLSVFPDIKARYVRCLIKKDRSSSRLLIGEIIINGSGNYSRIAQQNTAGITTDAAERLFQPQFKEIIKPSLQKGQCYATAKSFMSFNYLPANAIDGKLDTFWVSGQMSDQLIIGMGSAGTIPHLISGMKIFTKRGRGPRDYSIKVSLDGITWETVAIRKNMEYVERMEYFKPTPGWFIMLDIEANPNTILGPLVREIEVFTGEHRQGQFLIDGKDKKAISRVSPIALFQTEKCLYKLNQPIKAIAKFDVSDSSKRRSIKLFKCSGLDAWQLITEKPLEKNCMGVTLDIAPEKREYAHALRLVLFENDKEIDSKECLFEICDDWGKIMRPLAIPAYAAFSADYPDAGINSYVSKAREYYFNTIEFFASTPCYGALVPEKDTWVVQPLFCPATMNTYNKWRKALDNAGIKRMHYTETISAWKWKAKEEWLAYTPLKLTQAEGIWTMLGRKGGSVERWNAAGTGKTFSPYGLGPCPNISSPGYMDYFADQFTKAVDTFDFDAMFFDCFVRGSVLGAGCSDINGNPASEKNSDQVAGDFLSAMEAAVKKVSDKKIVFVCNNNIAMGVEDGEYQKPDFRQRVLNGEIKFPFPEMARHDIIWVHEYQIGKPQLQDMYKSNLNYPFTYQSASRLIQAIKQVGRCNPLAWWETLAVGTIDNIKALNAVVLANGGGGTQGFGIFDTIFVAGARLTADEEAIARIVKDYLHFSVRYEEYIKPLDIKWLPDGVFNCNVPDKVYWQDLCFEKTVSSSRKQYYLHLINLPGDEFSKKYDKLEDVRNIAIETEIPEGWQVSGIKLLSPDIAPEPVTIEYKQMSPHRIQYIIPQLQVWDFVIIDMKKPNSRERM